MTHWFIRASSSLAVVGMCLMVSGIVQPRNLFLGGVAIVVAAIMRVSHVESH